MNLGQKRENEDNYRIGIDEENKRACKINELILEKQTLRAELDVCCKCDSDLPYEIKRALDKRKYEYAKELIDEAEHNYKECNRLRKELDEVSAELDKLREGVV